MDKYFYYGEDLGPVNIGTLIKYFEPVSCLSVYSFTCTNQFMIYILHFSTFCSGGQAIGSFLGNGPGLRGLKLKGISF